MTDESPKYSRTEREGKLPFSTKFYQGLGAIPDTLKNFAFNTFVLLFYNQILGLNAFMVSIALMIAMVFDAVSDPLVGAFSDNLRTRWGRRHPLMLIAVLPLGLCFTAVFIPPDGLSESMLFVWLTVFTVLTRGFMTLYFVPWAAIAAELSDDYNERTQVMLFRFVVGWFVGVLAPLAVYTWAMPNTEAYPSGQLNPAGYPVMAICLGVALTCGALVTTLMTLREAPYLRQHAVLPPNFTFKSALLDMLRALKNRQFLLIFGVTFFYSAIAGTTANIGIYMQTYFWGLTSDDLRWYSLAALGAIVAFGLTSRMQSRFDKKHILITCSIIAMIDGIVIINLRFFDILPDNGSTLLLGILVANSIFSSVVGVIAGIIGASIVADILDDHELRTGYRQEAMFNAALSFSGKAVTGVGILLGGLIITLIEMPTGVAPADVPEDVIFRLGLVVGILIPLFNIITIALLQRYKLTREVVYKIQSDLADRRAAAHL
jgi:GPH family glycoside/pentoside/hexuronide:cation symporter